MQAQEYRFIEVETIIRLDCYPVLILCRYFSDQSLSLSILVSVFHHFVGAPVKLQRTFIFVTLFVRKTFLCFVWLGVCWFSSLSPVLCLSPLPYPPLAPSPFHFLFHFSLPTGKYPKSYSLFFSGAFFVFIQFSVCISTANVLGPPHLTLSYPCSISLTLLLSLASLILN